MLYESTGKGMNPSACLSKKAVVRLLAVIHRPARPHVKFNNVYILTPGRSPEVLPSVRPQTLSTHTHVMSHCPVILSPNVRDTFPLIPYECSREVGLEQPAERHHLQRSPNSAACHLQAICRARWACWAYRSRRTAWVLFARSCSYGSW